MPELDDERRLAAVRATGLLNREPDEILDRLTRVARALLRVPVAAASILDTGTHFFVSSAGMGDELTAAREMPVSLSFCRYTVESGATFAIPDTRLDARTCDNPAVAYYDVIAYAGCPILAPGGEVVGSFAVVDTEPHEWTPAELAALEDLAVAAGAEIALRLTTRQLEAERAYLAGVLDSVDVPVLACDAAGLVTVVNRAAVEAGARPVPFDAHQTGEYAEEYEADGRTPLRPPRTPLSRAARGEEVHGLELTSRRGGNSLRHLVANGRPIRDPDGAPLGAVVALHDVTAARQREVRRAARLAVASALAGSRTAEEAAVAATVALARALGWAYAEYWHADDDDATLVRLGAWRRDGGVPAPVDFRIARGQGMSGRAWEARRALWVPDIFAADSPFLSPDSARANNVRSAVALPVIVKGTMLGLIALMHDEILDADPDLVAELESVCVQIGEYILLATERERVLHTQQQQMDRLDQVSRMKDDLVAVVSHELRNPIAVIRAYAELLFDESLTADQRSFVETIESASQRMLGIVTDLLTLAEADAGRVEMQQSTLALDALVREAADEQRPALRDNGLVLHVSCAPGLRVHGDPQRLRQMVDNLLNNAVKYTPTGGRIDVSVHGEDHDAVIRVADTGIGIPAEQMPHMFTRFFRASTAREAGIRGTGLGLTIAKAIIEAHGGTIEVAGNEPTGSVFTVTLPLLRQE